MNEHKHEQRLRLLTKLSVLWDINPKESFCSLLSKLMGGDLTHYIVHTYENGSTKDTKRKHSLIVNVIKDEELEELIDGYI